MKGVKDIPIGVIVTVIGGIIVLIIEYNSGYFKKTFISLATSNLVDSSSTQTEKKKTLYAEQAIEREKTARTEAEKKLEQERALRAGAEREARDLQAQLLRERAARLVAEEKIEECKKELEIEKRKTVPIPPKYPNPQPPNPKEQTAIPAKGLIACYLFNGNANDETPNKNNAEVKGASLTEDRFEKKDCAYEFNGETNYIVASPIKNVVDNFAVSLWVLAVERHEIDKEYQSGYAGTQGQYYAVVPSAGSANWGIGNAGMGISVGTNGVSVYEHDADYIPAILTHEIRLDGWNHIVIQYVDKQPSLYLNGKFVKKGIRGSKPVARPSVHFGGFDYGYFRGKIDDVRIYNRVLSDYEIKQLFEESNWKK